jgi:hypothetical protein
MRIVAWGALAASVIFCGMPAWADECDEAAAEIAQLGVRIDPRNGDTITMHSRAVTEMSLDCPIGQTASLQMIRDGVPAPASYFNLLGKAGRIVTKADPNIIRDGAKKCLRDAASSPGGTAEMLFKGVAFECLSDVKAGVSVTVYIDTLGIMK